MHKIQTTTLFKILLNSKKRITIFQGGTRSSKTYTILQWIVYTLLKEKNKNVAICRATRPQISENLLPDFQKILKSMGLWDFKKWNKTELIYTGIGKDNRIKFLNLDEPNKIRGAQRDYVFMNEANNCTFSCFQELIFRTKTKFILDYNPTFQIHWIFDQVKTREDADFYISTYKDNPFLPISQIQEIERLKDIDENKWRQYGLGIQGLNEKAIYTNFEIGNFNEENYDEEFFGLDLGFSDSKTALISVRKQGNALILNELIYKSGLTNNDLILRLQSIITNKNTPIYIDSARPETIEQIYRDGFNAFPCVKGSGSVFEGIMKLKDYKLKINKNSVNLIKEIQNYTWRTDKNGYILDEPCKFNDHLMDALRYAVTSHIKSATKLSCFAF